MQGQTIDDNVRLAYWLVRRFRWAIEFDTAIDEDDLLQCAWLAILAASDTYRPEAGKSWPGWAKWYMRREVKRLLGWINSPTPPAHIFAKSLDAPLCEDSDETRGDMLADDQAPDPEEEAIHNALRWTLWRSIERLPDARQRRAIELIYLEGKSCAEGAQALGITLQELRNMNRRSIRHLSNNARLRKELMELDDRTLFHAHKGVAAFQRDWTSVTEGAALWRIAQEERANQRRTKDEQRADAKK